MRSLHKTKGTCSRSIDIELEDDVIKSVKFSDGCDGNLKAVSQLVVGMKASDVIDRFEGLRCGRKKTSCPDQLAKALKTMLLTEK